MTDATAWRRRLAVVGVAAIAIVAVRAVGADEGMWPFDNIPRAAIEARYGVSLDDAWIARVQRASVRFNNGGSGSFVSRDGLVLTNHHVVRDTLAALSSPEYDLVADGFLAERRGDELEAPALELNVLESAEDVTTRVNRAVRSDMSPADGLAARRAAIAEIERESLFATKLRSDVVTLYQGGQYHLYRYRRYTDVRIVFAPEESIAFFGGDIDNFQFPRFALDMALVRVYEHGEPVEVDQYVPWSTRGVAPGDPVFVSGHPGSTSRLNTVAHLETRRDFELPFIVRLLDGRRDSLERYGGRGEEQARRADPILVNIENNLKVLRGQARGLADPALMNTKREAEAALRTAVAARSTGHGSAGDPWEAIAAARNGLRAYYLRLQLVDAGHGFDSRLFDIARTLVRLGEESSKPDGERLPGFTDAARPSLELQLFSRAPIYAEFEAHTLADSLAFMRQELGDEDDTVRRVLLGASPEARADELVSGSRLADVGVRRRLAEGGRAAIDVSDDPMIALARTVDPEARALRRRYEDEVLSVQRDQYAAIARADFDTKGLAAYPDATFTLRLSYGAVRGYEDDGQEIAPFTRMGGLFVRSDDEGDQPPFALPPSWRDARQDVDPTVPLNFVSTTDIIGGNSGSPVLDAAGALVGLIFDGNVHSLNGDFIYDETLNRAIAVDTRGMVEALRVVYRAADLVDELMADQPVSRGRER